MSTELTKTGSTALSEAHAAGLLKYAGKGTEKIGQNDVRPPALCVAQGMSPQIKRLDAKYIPGLGEGDLFNTLSGEIYGQGPLRIIVIDSLGHRNVEFDPEKIGVVIDGNVPDGDPRTQFVDEVKDGEKTGKRLRPAATTFYDFLVFLPDHGEVMTLSFKSTAIKTAITLNSRIKYPLKAGGVTIQNPPAFARQFKVTVSQEKNDYGTWAGIAVQPDGLTDEKTLAICGEVYEAFAKKTVVVDRESQAEAADDGEGDDRVPF